MIIDNVLKNTAASYLKQHDAALAPIITRAGLCTIVPHREYYRALVNSIIGQQLSVKAAASIKQRFVNLFGGTFPAPQTILTKNVDELRMAGLSNAKARYILDLAQHVINGTVRFDQLDSQTNEEIITELTPVKGIGEWTVHMFLMFTMGRSDILAHGDLGIRTAIRKAYNLNALPSPAEMEVLAGRWRPWCSIASWYLWRSLEGGANL